jgi:hypothetical protein
VSAGRGYPAGGADRIEDIALPPALRLPVAGEVWASPIRGREFLVLARTQAPKRRMVKARDLTAASSSPHCWLDAETVAHWWTYVRTEVLP